MSLTPTLKINLRLEPLQQQVELASAAGLQEVFSVDIEAEAKRLSPHKTGHNARTIDSDVELTPGGPKAALFTQSGYGGYLETGTRKMAARPYLWPAAAKFFKAIPERIREKLKA